MKRSRFTEEQIVKMLREADRTSVAAVSMANGVSEQSIYTWSKQYGGMAIDEVRRPWQLEQENARLKKVLAECVLEIEVLKEIAAKSGERACSSSAGCAGKATGSVGASSVQAAQSRTLSVALSQPDGAEG